MGRPGEVYWLHLRSAERVVGELPDAVLQDPPEEDRVWQWGPFSDDPQGHVHMVPSSVPPQPHKAPGEQEAHQVHPLSAELPAPTQPSLPLAQSGTTSGGDTGPGAEIITATTQGLKDPLLEISLKMLQSLEPRLHRDPEVTGFGNYLEAVLEDLPRDLRAHAMEDLTQTLQR